MAKFSTLLHFVSTIVHGASSSQHIISSPQDACVSQDSPNGHAQQYPDLVSGNLNGTTLIVPISLETARQVIPKEYGIVEEAYRELLPSFPAGIYPMMAQIVHDHDVQLPVYNASLADFSRASLEFPFVDIFGDGRSSFRWADTFLMSAANPLAIEGAKGYGVTVYPSIFDPPCDAYKALSGGATYAHTRGSNGSQSNFMTIETRPFRKHVPYPLDFIKNITNQPVFANTQTCDYFVRLFNTTLIDGAVPVVGTVKASLDPFKEPQNWSGVYGWKIATPFLEPPTPAECKPTA
ncbi:hypothetical protein F5Y13DRAFT_178779 [Hypoxylon sp. FL1857]|nr:hypothetical protein F5Y13DRAFT_178779 [Hypoxylon sp. FL1857]